MRYLRHVRPGGTIRGTAGFIVVVTAAVLAFAGIAVAAQQGGREGITACQSNLKQLSLGVLMYVQDYDEVFPAMTTPAHLQHRVLPYVKNRSVFNCPVTQADYQGNPGLNYVRMAAIKSPATTVLLRDVKPHTDEADKPVWNAAYADGHVKSLLSEPELGKPAPMPKPLPPLMEVRRRLKATRDARRTMVRQLDAQIRALEAEERRLSRRH